MIKQIFILSIIPLMLISFVNAEIFKQGDLVDINKPCINNGTYCSGSASCNITMNYPNGSYFITNQEMTNKLYSHNYTINAGISSPKVLPLGFYPYTIMCCDGGLCATNTFEMEVNGNGKPAPQGATIVLFSLLFLIVSIGLIYLSVHNVGHFIMMDFDIVDLAMNLSAYVGLFVIYMLQDFYVGNPQIESILIWVLSITGLTNVFIPVIALITSISIQTIQRKQAYYGRTL